MALNDPGNDRHVHAKYLGYLMRSGCLDVDLIFEMYSKPTRKDCLQVLYEPSWHERKGSVLDEKNAKKVVPNGNEVLGVMNTTTTRGDELGDVFLAGYGQCGTTRSLLPEVDAMAEAIAILPTEERGLRSLDLLFLNGTYTIQGILRIVTTLGRTLEELKLENEDGAFPLRSLFLVLETCTKLRKLHIKEIVLTPRDDTLLVKPPSTRAPLEALSIEIARPEDDEEWSGLAGLCKVIGNYASTVKELDLIVGA